MEVTLYDNERNRPVIIEDILTTDLLLDIPVAVTNNRDIQLTPMGLGRQGGKNEMLKILNSLSKKVSTTLFLDYYQRLVRMIPRIRILQHGVDLYINDIRRTNNNIIINLIITLRTFKYFTYILESVISPISNDFPLLPPIRPLVEYIPSIFNITNINQYINNITNFLDNETNLLKYHFNVFKDQDIVDIDPNGIAIIENIVNHRIPFVGIEAFDRYPYPHKIMYYGILGSIIYQSYRLGMYPLPTDEMYKIISSRELISIRTNQIYILTGQLFNWIIRDTIDPYVYLVSKSINQEFFSWIIYDDLFNGRNAEEIELYNNFIETVTMLVENFNLSHEKGLFNFMIAEDIILENGKNHRIPVVPQRFMPIPGNMENSLIYRFIRQFHELVTIHLLDNEELIGVYEDAINYYNTVWDAIIRFQLLCEKENIIVNQGPISSIYREFNLILLLLTSVNKTYRDLIITFLFSRGKELKINCNNNLDLPLLDIINSDILNPTHYTLSIKTKLGSSDNN